MPPHSSLAHATKVSKARKGRRLTVSAGTPDAAPALADEPVYLLHEPLRAVLVLLAESEHGRERRNERAIRHREPVAREGLLGSVISPRRTRPRHAHMHIYTHLHMVKKPCGRELFRFFVAASIHILVSWMG